MEPSRKLTLREALAVYGGLLGVYVFMIMNALRAAH